MRGWRVRRRASGAAGASGLALVLLAALALAGCSNRPSGGHADADRPLTGDCAEFQPYAGHPGTTVTMFSSVLSPESDALERSWALFSRCTGIAISYEGSADFESQLPVRVSGGNAPDLAVVQQPGLLAQMVKTGKVVRPPEQTVSDEADWAPEWKTYGSVGGVLYAAPMSANMKSLVWYAPGVFKAHGWPVPTSWSALMALSARIAREGAAHATGQGSGASAAPKPPLKPWCGGIGSGSATGWPATDWVEETVLGAYGGQVYDRWISHRVTFSDPPVIAAMNTVQGWMHNPAWVNAGIGDVRSIASTTFQDAGLPIRSSGCAMLQQASFYEAQWPKGTTVGPDGDVYAFKLPAVNPSVGTPVEGGGDFVAAFSSRPEVQAVQDYLSTAAWAVSRIKQAPGWVSANQKVPPGVYTDPIDSLSSHYLTDPHAVFRFDASDLMPAAVGSGAEWREFTAWFAQNQSVTRTAANVDAAWPR